MGVGVEQIDVLAVVGSCAPERQRFAARLAAETSRMLIPAQRLNVSPDPVDEAVSLAPWTDRTEGAVAEFPQRTLTTELIGALVDPESGIRLSGVVCVADAGHLLEDLRCESYAFQPALPWQRGISDRYTAHAMLAVTQIEYASTIVLVNWEALSTPELSTVMALVSHLGPHARLRLERGGDEGWASLGGTPYTAAQERPGWVGILNGDHDPHMTDPRVSSFRYENVRPLHPGRFEQLLNDRVEAGEFGALIRSAGFCRLATRPRLTGRWDHVGRMVSLEPIAGDDALDEALGEALGEENELLAFGQDLALTGLDLDRQALTAALDEAVLDDDELAAGPAAWRGFPDPFPAWSTIADRAE